MINLHELFREKLNDAYSLMDIGINEYAWDYENICLLIKKLKERRIPILGGDVYLVDNGTITPTYDSWYTKKDAECDYCESSYLQTLEYIDLFEDKVGKYIYSIVI